MAASDDILRTYRRPRVVMREHLARPASEPRALVFLLLALTVIFIGQWPRLSRVAHEMPDQPMVGLMMGTMLALLATVPIFYLIAALGHLVAKVMGGQGSWYGARLALFWALLAVSPMMLLQGLVAGFIGIGPQLSLVSVLVGVAFLLFWVAGLRVSEFEGKTN
ncbi:Yip1 family protein [Thioclava pacifica]|uniref:Yip1 domain-containing protein n=1 Tax=Thioclava pacifica DSM 10166 TaxID=1353537 RepID=A0A074J7M9_9RHOB|nr:Yip1 family protein [Thioclava pacifica]KEO51890.1 hypothetical protein TP2_10455 [Thioclava pacifica DSM 10166]